MRSKQTWEINKATNGRKNKVTFVAYEISYVYKIAFNSGKNMAKVVSIDTAGGTKLG